LKFSWAARLSRETPRITVLLALEFGVLVAEILAFQGAARVLSLG
jgi:hypothetical protein